MNLPNESDLATRLHFAARIATEAGHRLAALRASGRWPDEAILGDVGDQAADGYLQGYLRGRHPDDGLLSEETKDAAERLGKRLVWIVDPLDGTKEYSSGRHDWAVHIGLAVDGVPVLGAVALPAIGRVMAGVCAGPRPQAILLGSEGEWPQQFAADSGPVAAPARLRMACSRSHTPEWTQRFARELGEAELVPCGSVGFKVAMLLFGKADLYVHQKGLKEWDTCAPEAVARAAGWAVFRLDGSDQRYNQGNPRCDQIVVCRPWLRERVLAGLAACGVR